jgi:hypothetical protein
MHFKLTQHRGFTRRVAFEQSPSWNELAAKIGALYDIPTQSVAVSYVDSDGDQVTLSSQEELQDYYLTEVRPNETQQQPVKLFVQDMRHFGWRGAVDIEQEAKQSLDEFSAALASLIGMTGAAAVDELDAAVKKVTDALTDVITTSAMSTRSVPPFGRGHHGRGHHLHHPTPPFSPYVPPFPGHAPPFVPGGQHGFPFAGGHFDGFPFGAPPPPPPHGGPGHHHGRRGGHHGPHPPPPPGAPYDAMAAFLDHFHGRRRGSRSRSQSPGRHGHFSPHHHGPGFFGHGHGSRRGGGRHRGEGHHGARRSPSPEEQFEVTE